MADLNGDKSMLITATPLARVTVDSLINSRSVTHINIYIYTHTLKKYHGSSLDTQIKKS